MFSSSRSSVCTANQEDVSQDPVRERDDKAFDECVHARLLAVLPRLHLSITMAPPLPNMLPPPLAAGAMANIVLCSLICSAMNYS
jgi:hypothetical protein